MRIFSLGRKNNILIKKKRVYAGTTSACRICHALTCDAVTPIQSFSSFRLNCGELVDFRLFTRLYLLEKLCRNFSIVYEVLRYHKTDELN